jgi:hypothetical protein
MSTDLIIPGVKVRTRGGVSGNIDSIVRHPLSRSVLAVIVMPTGVTNPDDRIVAGTRHLKAIA